jgi:hypothetical protein
VLIGHGIDVSSSVILMIQVNQTDPPLPPKTTPYSSSTLFDFPTLQSFNPNFYLSENHHIAYLQNLLQYFHLEEKDNFVSYLKALERLENPLSLPLVIKEIGGNVTISIDFGMYQDALEGVGIHFNHGDKEEDDDGDNSQVGFKIGAVFLRYKQS